jgi:hypothetical protein
VLKFLNVFLGGHADCHQSSGCDIGSVWMLKEILEFFKRSSETQLETEDAARFREIAREFEEESEKHKRMEDPRGL